jgi:hypothetical protein
MLILKAVEGKGNIKARAGKKERKNKNVLILFSRIEQQLSLIETKEL